MTGLFTILTSGAPSIVITLLVAWWLDSRRKDGHAELSTRLTVIETTLKGGMK